MATLATLVVRLTTDAKDFDSGMSRSINRTRQFVQSTKKALSSIKQDFDKAGTGFADTGSHLRDAFGWIGIAASGVGDAIRGVGSAMAAAGKEVVRRVPALNRLASGFGTLRDRVRALPGQLVTFARRMGSNLRQFVTGIPLVRRLSGAFSTMAQSVKSRLLPPLQRVQTAFGNVAQSIRSRVVSAVQRVQSVFKTVGSGIQRFGGPIIGGLRTALGGLGQGLSSALQAAGAFGGAIARLGSGVMGVGGIIGRFGGVVRGVMGDALAKAGSVIGAGVAKLGLVAATGLVGATVALGGLGIDIGKLAVDAAPLEAVGDAFEGLAESAGVGADEMLDALQRGSAGMIANRDLMLTFNKAAQLVSTDFATQLPDAMEYLSKVSASTGQDMGYLLDSLVTGVGRLSPAILDNLSIQASLSDATARASEMFGIQADELTKAQVQAGMMNVVLEKLATNTASMPDVTEGAAAGMARWRATVQNTKDTIGGAFVPVLQSLMTSAQPLIDKFLPMITAGLSTLAEKALPVVDAVGQFIGWIIAGENPLAAFKVLLFELFPDDLAARIWQGMVQIVAKAQELASQGQAALQPFVAWLQTNLPIAFAVIKAVWENVLRPALAGLASLFRDVILPIIIRLGERMQGQIVPALIAIGVVALLAVAPFILLGAALVALGYIWNKYGEQVKTTLSQLKVIVVSYLNQAATSAQMLGGIIRAVFTRIGMAIQGVIDKVRAFAEKIKNIRLPDFLTPGSPTPFEIGLRGIADAANSLARMSLPAMSAGLGGMAAPAMAAAPAGVGGGGGIGVVNIYITESDNPQATANAVIQALRDRGLLPQTSYR